MSGPDNIPDETQPGGEDPAPPPDDGGTGPPMSGPDNVPDERRGGGSNGRRSDRTGGRTSPSGTQTPPGGNAPDRGPGALSPTRGRTTPAAGMQRSRHADLGSPEGVSSAAAADVRSEAAAGDPAVFATDIELQRRELSESERQDLREDYAADREGVSADQVEFEETPYALESSVSEAGRERSLEYQIADRYGGVDPVEIQVEERGDASTSTDDRAATDDTGRTGSETTVETTTTTDSAAVAIAADQSQYGREDLTVRNGRVGLTEDAMVERAAEESGYGASELAVRDGEIVVTDEARRQRAAEQLGVSQPDRDVRVVQSATGTSPVRGQAAPAGEAERAVLTASGYEEYAIEQSDELADYDAVRPVRDPAGGYNLDLTEEGVEQRQDYGGFSDEGITNPDGPIRSFLSDAGDTAADYLEPAADVQTDVMAATARPATAAADVVRPGTADRVDRSLDRFGSGLAAGANVPQGASDAVAAGQIAGYVAGQGPGDPISGATFGRAVDVGRAFSIETARAGRSAIRNPMRTTGAIAGGAALGAGAAAGARGAASAVTSTGRGSAAVSQARRAASAARGTPERVGSDVRRIARSERGQGQIPRSRDGGGDGGGGGIMESLEDELARFERGERMRRAEQGAREIVERGRELAQRRRSSPSYEDGEIAARTVDNRPGGDYVSELDYEPRTVSRSPDYSRSGPTATQQRAFSGRGSYEYDQASSSVERYLEAQRTDVADSADEISPAAQELGSAPMAAGTTPALLTLAERQEATVNDTFLARPEDTALLAGVQSADGQSVAVREALEMREVAEAREVTERAVQTATSPTQDQPTAEDLAVGDLTASRPRERATAAEREASDQRQRTEAAQRGAAGSPGWQYADRPRDGADVDQPGFGWFSTPQRTPQPTAPPNRTPRRIPFPDMEFDADPDDDWRRDLEEINRSWVNPIAQLGTGVGLFGGGDDGWR